MKPKFVLLPKPPASIDTVVALLLDRASRQKGLDNGATWTPTASG
jgi:hypothetical protein